MNIIKQSISGLVMFSAFIGAPLQAQVLPQADIGIKFALTQKSTTRPMTVAYIPTFKNYYIADGGLAPMS